MSLFIEGSVTLVFCLKIQKPSVLFRLSQTNDRLEAF
jgi:hypothetical protein